MSYSWRGGSTRAHRRVREYVLERDGYACQLRIEGTWMTRNGLRWCQGEADCVHHTHGKRVTGDDPAYMIASCTPCNLKVGDPTKTNDPQPRRLTRW